jgi:hypothetical protein
MLGPEEVDGRCAADHDDDRTFDNTGCRLVSKQALIAWSIQTYVTSNAFAKFVEDSWDWAV